VEAIDEGARYKVHIVSRVLLHSAVRYVPWPSGQSYFPSGTQRYNLRQDPASWCATRVSAGDYSSYPVRPDTASGHFLERYLANISFLEIGYVNEFCAIARYYVDVVICSLLGRPVVATATRRIISV
jgi:hypothetical protein